MEADDHQEDDGIKESMSDAEDDKDSVKVNFFGAACGQGGVRLDAPLAYAAVAYRDAYSAATLTGGKFFPAADSVVVRSRAGSQGRGVLCGCVCVYSCYINGGEESFFAAPGPGKWAEGRHLRT